MSKLTSCIIADEQKNLFECVSREGIIETLSTKLGGYTDVVCQTIATEDGGYVEFQIGMYDERDILLNFATELEKKMDLADGDGLSILSHLVENENISIDIEWNQKDCFKNSILYYDNEKYDDVELDADKKEVLNALYEVVEEFVNEKMNAFCSDFDRQLSYYESTK